MKVIGQQTIQSKSSPISFYGFLALPLAFVGLPLYMNIPDFYTRELGLSLATAGMLLMSLRVIDAIQDPFIGYICDKNPSLQRPIILCGLIKLLIGMGMLLFGPPAGFEVAPWFACGIAITALGLSMMGINLVMIGSLWSADKTVRASTSAARESFTLGGMLLASITPSVLFLYFSKDEAFEVFYFIFAALLLLGIFLFLKFYNNISPESPLYRGQSSLSSVKIPFVFFKNNHWFLASSFLTHLAASFPAILFLYFVSDLLGVSEKAGLFLFLYFISGAVFMPLWLKIARHYSEERTWCISMVLAITTFIWAFMLGAGDVWPFAIICVLSGAALGADLALPPVIMAKRLEIQNAQAYAAQAYAILNVIPKLALAVGTGCAFLLLSTAAFVPAQENSPQSLWSLSALYALVPCALKIISASIVFYYSKGEMYDFQKRSFNDGHSHGA